jgi:hypothetical protein
MSINPEAPMYCYNHPKRETHLRCNRCERPICSSCAVLTPTGYRCKECVRGQQKKFDTAKWWDLPVAVIVAVVLSGVGSYFASLLGFFSILVAPLVGMGIAEAVRFMVKRRRSRILPATAAISTLVGGIAYRLYILIFSILISLQSGQAGLTILSLLISLLWPVVFALLAASTVLYRLKGITI